MMNAAITKVLTANVPLIILLLWTVGCAGPGASDRLPVETLQTRAQPVIVTQTDPEEEDGDSEGTDDDTQVLPVDPETIREMEKQAARYQARRIGERLGRTADQDSFTDFPYDALNYDLLEPRSNWITDDNMDAEDTFIPFDSASVDRGDGWTEHGMKRSRPAVTQEDIEAAQDLANVANAEAEAVEALAAAAEAAAIAAGTVEAADRAAAARAAADYARAAAADAAEAYAAVLAESIEGKSVSETITAYSDAVPALEIALAAAEAMLRDAAQKALEAEAAEAAAAVAGTAEAAEAAAQAAAEAAAAQAAAEAAKAAVTVIESGTSGEPSGSDPGTENVDDPWVHFGWWLEMSEDEEPPNYRFATFVDGGGRYGIPELQNVAAGTARYEGPAAGVYVKREPTTLNTYWGRFNAKVDLTAEFYGADDSDGRVLSLEGGISNFVDGDSETALHDWSATLRLNSGSSDADGFFGSVVVTAPGFDSEGTALYGTWQAHFHEGSAWYKGDGLAGVPGTVAGQFRAFRPRLRADASPSDSGYFEQPIVQSDSSRHFDDQGFLGLAGAFGAHLRSYYAYR